MIWQGSFDFGGYGPNDPAQTFIFWAVSILIFLLMVTLGFMLVRIGVKLYIERRSNREGSRIKTKLRHRRAGLERHAGVLHGAVQRTRAEPQSGQMVQPAGGKGAPGACANRQSAAG